MVDQAGRTTRILVADDEDLLRSILRAFLATRGHEVVEASSGAEALDAIARGAAGLDLAILDVHMPCGDGFRVLRELRDSRPDLPVLISSGDAVELPPAELEGEGAARLLPKPFRLADLGDAVDDALARPRAE